MSNIEISPEIMEEASKRISWIQYKGKEIEIDAFTNLSRDEFIGILRVNTEITLNMGKNSILSNIDYNNNHTNKHVLNALKEKDEKTEHFLD